MKVLTEVNAGDYVFNDYSLWCAYSNFIYKKEYVVKEVIKKDDDIHLVLKNENGTDEEVNASNGWYVVKEDIGKGYLIVRKEDDDNV